MSGNPYPAEFKVKAVNQVVNCDHSVSSVATRLGITTHSLYVWTKNSQMLMTRAAYKNEQAVA